jgi:uncharacterized membrane protein YcaP (DUF421 family)
MQEYLQIIASSAAVYIFIIAAIRLFGKKELAQLTVIDLVFILLISNAVQNAMVGSNSTLAGGLIAAGTLFAINALLKFLFYRFPKLEKLVQGEPVILIYKGKLNPENMRKVSISKDELDEVIREHGVADATEVDMAILEVDGNISILSDNFRNRSTRKRKSHRKFNRTIG